MTSKMKLKITLDLLMTILLPMLMAYQLVGDMLHEWFGVLMLLLFILHHLLNIQWHKNIAKGKYTPLRILSLFVNIAILGLMLSLMISGIVMSRYVFVFLPIRAGMSWARLLHLFASYWCFIFLSFHIGLHGNMIVSMMKQVMKVEEKSVIRTIILRIVAALVIIFGIIAFIKREFTSYLFLRTHFVFFDYSEPLAFFFLDYIMMMGMFALLAYYITKLLRRSK